MKRYQIFTACLLCLLCSQANARVEKFRIIWQEDPASTATIAWHQASGDNPMLYLDINDYDNDWQEYAVMERPDRVQLAKGMKNFFVRLTGLHPNTTYYFIIKDSEGLSRRLFFTTAPNRPDQRLSIIAGGDSRNNRDARIDANRLVAKLRPHCVMFGGDFTAEERVDEWMDWFDDWQLTIARDGKVTPIIVCRGNHEESNQSLIDLFDLKFPTAFYAQNLGGNLLRIYTLNTLIPAGGQQVEWLEKDLKANSDATWKIAQYHFPMRPHTQQKVDKNDQTVFWAPLFHKYNLNLAIECDAHVVKYTHPIRPDNGHGSDQGFIRDDEAGTVFIGEGCWGAPLRANNDDKAWTRASGSFNQFHWIFIDREKIEVRTVKTDGSEFVGEVDKGNIFSAPRGLNIWNPPTGAVLQIHRQGNGVPVEPQEQEPLFAPRGKSNSSSGAATAPPIVPRAELARGEMNETDNWEICPQLAMDAAQGNVKIKYEVEHSCNVVIRLVNLKLQEVTRIEIPNQAPGEYLKSLEMKHLPPGRYLAVVKADKKVLQRYRIKKEG
ncbi:MAG: metallophosphoesterase family protein [Bacteroidota bacterium]